MNPEITMKQLHSELMDAVQAKGAIVGDVGEFVRTFLSTIGGGLAPEVVVLQAEVNQAQADIARLQEKIATDVYKWIDGRAQGDLFHDLPFRCPKSIQVDGQPISCYEATIPQIHEYLGYLAELRGKAAKAAREIAQLKEQWHEIAAVEHTRCGEVIARCVENGIDPNSIRIDRAQS